MTEDFSPRRRSTRALLEREAELAELQGLLVDARAGRGRVALIQGPAGIGKTRLIDEVRERAGAAGMGVLFARGGELERDYGFGLVRQLLEPALALAGPAGRERLMTDAAGHAKPVFAPDVADRAAGDPTHVTLHGLYWLLANLAEDSPLLLAVDDVQWGDAPSLRFLIHLARRLDGLPVAVALAIRTGEEAIQPELLRALTLEAHPPILRPRPLSGAAVASVVAAALGPDAGPMLSEACHEASGGNPFLLSELVEELHEESRPTGEISPAVVARLAPERITTALLLRVGRVGPAAPALARAVAVLGAGAHLGHVAEVADITTGEARELAGALAGSAVLERGEPLRFVHPILRTAIYDDIPARERSELHGRAARLLQTQDADVEAIAVHLLATDPAADAAAVEKLREAARAALPRGAPETATRYLRRALDEPPDEASRAGVLTELGSVAARSGELDGIDMMRQAFDRSRDSGERAAVGFQLGTALLWDAREVDESVTVLERTLEDVGEGVLATPVEALLLLTGVTTGGARAHVAERLREARRRVEELPDEQAQFLLAPIVVDMAISDGTAPEVTRLAERALAGGTLLQEQLRTDLPLIYMPAWALVHAGQVKSARRVIEMAIAQTQARGSPLGLAIASAFASFASLRASDLLAAEEAARTSLELAAEPGWGIPNPMAAAALVEVLVERGDLDGARGVLVRIDGTYDPEVMPNQVVRESRARLRIAEGDPRGALDDLLACGRWESNWKLGTGVVPVPWRSGAALAHAALGEEAEAHELAQEEVELARRFGAERPIGVALRALGLVEGGERGIELLEEAASTLGQSEARLERGRALVDLGAALRRSGRRGDARKRLAEGMDLAQRCGATVVMERARDELLAAGARPRRIALTGADALTPSERRVTRMASEGMTNKEIAQALFVTVRTVEMHLTNAYGKLGISSRHELPGSGGRAET